MKSTTKSGQVLIQRDLLSGLFDMAASHVDDLESGLDDGTYQADENKDAGEKRASLNQAQAVLEGSDSKSVQPPFMTSVGGHVLIHDGDTGKPLASDWCGICVGTDSAKAFWLIGREGGERSFMKLPITVTTPEEAQVYVASLTTKEPATPAISATHNILEDRYAVMSDVLPRGINTDWIILNAPRPLVGDQCFENGEFVHGRFYAAVDPNGSMAEKWLKINFDLDAKIVFQANPEMQQAMAFELIPDEYKPNFIAMSCDSQNNALQSYLSHLRKPRTLKAINELASKVGQRRQTCALSAVGNRPD